MLNAFQILDQHLGMVDSTWSDHCPHPDQNRKYYISEPAAAFEKIVMPKCLNPNRRILDPLPPAAIVEMNKQEGQVFEQLCYEYCAGLPMFDRVERSVELFSGVKNDAEIDVVGESEEHRHDRVWKLLLASCKRNPSRHDRKKNKQGF